MTKTNDAACTHKCCRLILDCKRKHKAFVVVVSDGFVSGL